MKNNKEHTEACDATKLCCCHNILLNQSDFLEQSTALEEILEERGHICWMLPLGNAPETESNRFVLGGYEGIFGA